VLLWAGLLPPSFIGDLSIKPQIKPQVEGDVSLPSSNKLPQAPQRGGELVRLPSRDFVAMRFLLPQCRQGMMISSNEAPQAPQRAGCCNFKDGMRFFTPHFKHLTTISGGKNAVLGMDMAGFPYYSMWQIRSLVVLLFGDKAAPFTYSNGCKEQGNQNENPNSPFADVIICPKAFPSMSKKVMPRQEFESHC